MKAPRRPVSDRIAGLFSVPAGFHRIRTLARAHELEPLPSLSVNTGRRFDMGRRRPVWCGPGIRKDRRAFFQGGMPRDVQADIQDEDALASLVSEAQLAAGGPVSGK
jgi:hypothetical protein